MSYSFFLLTNTFEFGPSMSSASSKPIIEPGARVAVVGAGPAGLRCGRQLRACGYQPVIFEKHGSLGGVWETSLQVKSPIYSTLFTNLPKHVMTFENDTYPTSFPTFLPHKTVLQYLRSYSKKHNLNDIIRFHHEVIHVSKNEDENIWKVVTKSKTEEKHWEFDAVFICSGHFSKPMAWEVEGFENLQKNNILVEHSMNYDGPDELKFGHKNVLIIGAASSGIDISIELSKVASKVFLSHSKGKPLITEKKPQNLHEVSRVKNIFSDGTIETDGGHRLYGIDCVITCNGYQREYSYLHSDAFQLSKDNVSIFGLLRHCVCIADPTLIFIGVTTHAIAFPTFESQVMFSIAVLQRNVITLDRYKKLVEEERLFIQNFKENNIPKRSNWWKNLHVLGAQYQWEYIVELTTAAGIRPPSPSIIELSKFCSTVRRNDPVSYRGIVLEIHGEESGMWTAKNVKYGEKIVYSKEIE